MQSSERVQVICRFRGDAKHRKHQSLDLAQKLNDNVWEEHGDKTVRNPAGKLPSKDFHFDKVLNQNATQVQVFQEAGHASVQALLQGYNATVLAYGQSGSGKTFTMLGSDAIVQAIKKGSLIPE